MLEKLSQLHTLELEQQNFIKLTLGDLSPTGKDCVFLWIYCDDALPYWKHSATPSKPISCVYAQLRWDGSFGTVGGKVDPGENLDSALKREAKEEIGLDLENYKNKPELFSSLQSGDFHIHAYSLKVTSEELYALRNTAFSAQECPQECSGFNIIHLTEYKKSTDTHPIGIMRFMDNRFAMTAKAELLTLITKYKLI